MAQASVGEAMGTSEELRKELVEHFRKVREPLRSWFGFLLARDGSLKAA